MSGGNSITSTCWDLWHSFPCCPHVIPSEFPLRGTQKCRGRIKSCWPENIVKFDYYIKMGKKKKVAWPQTPLLAFPGSTSGKEPICQCRRCKRCGFNPWVGKIPWRRKGQCIPVLLPGDSHRQRSLAGYSPWGHKESDTTEAT